MEIEYVHHILYCGFLVTCTFRLNTTKLPVLNVVSLNICHVIRALYAESMFFFFFFFFVVVVVVCLFFLLFIYVYSSGFIFSKVILSLFCFHVVF